MPVLEAVQKDSLREGMASPGGHTAGCLLDQRGPGPSLTSRARCDFRLAPSR
jgi:hypothetical protein